MTPNRTVPAALALLALAGMTVLAAGVGPVAGLGSSAAPAPAGPASGSGATTVGSTASADSVGGAAAGDGFTECTNGTSRSVLACGYQPGPTAIELSARETAGESVTVRAVNLSAGGFVAVHRESFVNGNVVGSTIGVSRHLDAGLHRNVTIELDESLSADATLVAVAYRDDGDATFEFVSSGGTTDRPYTNTYSRSTGNVTDEAGDVIGDIARVTVVEPAGPTVVPDRPATDPDGDGLFEDVNGDGSVTPGDATVLFRAVFDGNAAVTDNVASFDFNGDGSVTPGDATALFDEGF